MMEIYGQKLLLDFLREYPFKEFTMPDIMHSTGKTRQTLCTLFGKLTDKGFLVKKELSPRAYNAPRYIFRLSEVKPKRK